MTLPTAFDNVAKHVALAASLPLGYAWLPAWCCCVMPTVRYAMDEETPNSKMDAMDRCAMNFAGLAMGFYSTISCCCCLGCCGTQSPQEVYGPA